METEFESFANSERYKTEQYLDADQPKFESFANSERYKTQQGKTSARYLFESFANSERYKTKENNYAEYDRLRALLIQKDTKLHQLLITLKKV